MAERAPVTAFLASRVEAVVHSHLRSIGAAVIAHLARVLWGMIRAEDRRRRNKRHEEETDRAWYE